MTEFTKYDETNAPEGSKALLSDSKASVGFVPNLHAVMAEAPGLLEAYKVVGGLFQKSSFDKDELTVVWQTINVEHNCDYCVPGHTAIAHMMKVDTEISNALRDETPLPSDRLEALRTFTLKVVRGRGNVSEEDVNAFLSAGYSKQQILEVILGLSHKVMSNYTNHLAGTPVDAPAAMFAWTKSDSTSKATL